MDKMKNTPDGFDDKICLDAESKPGRLDKASRPSDRTTISIPKEHHKQMRDLQKVTGVSVRDQALRAIDAYLALHTDTTRDGRLVPSRTGSRLRRLSGEYETEEGWFVRVGVAVLVALLESPAVKGGGSLFEDLHTKAQDDDQTVPDLIVQLLGQQIG